MMFRLNKDKIIIADSGDRFVARPFVLQGVYPIVRIFDKDRVMVDLSKRDDNRILTLLKIDAGEILGEDNEPK